MTVNDKSLQHSLGKLMAIWLAMGIVLIPFIRYSNALWFPEADRALSIGMWVIGMLLVTVARLVCVTIQENQPENMLKSSKKTPTIRYFLTENKVLIALLTLLGWLVLCSFVDTRDLLSLSGFGWRADGLWLVLAFAMLAGCISYWSTVRSYTHEIGLSLRVTALLLLLTVSLAYLFSSSWSEMLRLSLGSELYLANLLAMFGIWLFFGVRTRTGWFLALALYSWNLYVLWRLDVIVPLLVSVFAIMLYLLVVSHARRGRSSKRKWLLVIGSVVVALSGSFFWIQQHRQDFITNTVSHEGRLVLYSKLFAAVQEKPVFGWGWNQVHVAFRSQYPEAARAGIILLDRAHSIWLEWLVATGWVGLCLFIVLVSLVWSTLFFANQSSQTHPNTEVWWYRLACIWVLCYFLLASVNVVSVYADLVWWIIVGVALAKR